MDELNKIPPVTRTLVGATLAITVLPMLQVLSAYNLVYDQRLVFQRYEFWRPFTSFFYGGTGIGFVIDLVMLYRNSNALESTQYSRRSYDYGWQLLISGTAILLLNIPFRSFFHFRQLLICLVYLTSALDPEAITSIWGIVSFKQKYFPWVLTAFDVLSGGGLMSIARNLTGIVVGHAWFTFEHAPGRRAARFAAASGERPPRGATGGFLYDLWDQISNAPSWFRHFVVGSGEDGFQRATRTDRRSFGDAQAPRGRTLNESGSSSSSRPSTQSHDWGKGSRLGSGSGSS